MTPSSRPGKLLRSRPFQSACGYVAAIVLPWLGTTLSKEAPALHGTPLALSFASVATITIFTGIGPGIAAAIASALVFNHCVLAHRALLSLSPTSVVHTLVILCVGLLVALLCERQRVTGNRLRAALASLQVRTDSLMEAQQGSNSAAWMYNVEDRRLHWAEGGAKVFGIPFAELTTPDAPREHVLYEDRARVEDAVAVATASGQSFEVEFRVRWPNGDLHWLESRGTPSASNRRIWHGVTIDVTDRKNAEFALVRSEKLAAIGRLSATIAHEVNNPMEAVTNLLYLALADPRLPPEARDYLQRADQELARLATIARRTLTFVRPKSSSGPANAVEVVESVVAMFQPRCVARGGDIRILRDGELMLPVPPDDLRQILTNIVSNACDALPDSGGRIEVEIASQGTTASLSIRDNGSGIAPDNLRRVFDPFFTTKEDVGTGIGLWVTKDLVEKNGGHIIVQTHDLPAGFQTMFRVELPLR